MKIKTHAVPDDVAAILKRSTVLADRIILPLEQLDRKQYEAVNKVIEMLGGKWNRAAKAHIFPPPERVPATLSNALDSRAVVDKKKSFQDFQTPVALARRMAQKLLPLSKHARVLEPSAGSGRLIDAVLEVYPGARIVYCEMQIDLHAELNKKAACLNDCFLATNPVNNCAAVIMNPPFTNAQDCEHIRHAYDFLKKGGVLVAISSPGWLFNTNIPNTKFRDWMLGLAGECKATWEELPAGTFSESGTEVRSLLLTIRK